MNTTTLQFNILNLVKVAILATNLFLIIAIGSDYISMATAQTSDIELVSSSIDGGGGEMSSGSLTMDTAIGESQPIGEASSASFTLDSGFIPIISNSSVSNPTPTPTPIPSTSTPTATPSANPTATPTATPTTSVLEAPATSTIGIAVLFFWILAVMLFGFWVMNGNKKSKVV